MCHDGQLPWGNNACLEGERPGARAQYRYDHVFVIAVLC